MRYSGLPHRFKVRWLALGGGHDMIAQRGAAGQPSHRITAAMLAPRLLCSAVVRWFMAKRVRKWPTLAELPPLPRLPSKPTYTTVTIHDKKTHKTRYLGEEYGIHSVSFDDADERAPDCAIAYNQLFDSAISRLKEAGEKTAAADILKSVETTQPGDERAQLVALNDWWLDIANRRGIISPLSMAARFLLTSEVAMSVLAQPAVEPTKDDPHRGDIDLDRKMLVMCDFAHAWHLWHMEVFGEHADAYSGQLQKKHLAKGAGATKARARRRDDIILRCVIDILPESASHIANHRFKTVNAALKDANLPTIKSQRAFAKHITRIKKAGNRKPGGK